MRSFWKKESIRYGKGNTWFYSTKESKVYLINRKL